jgi:hypothetical protein
VRQVDAADHVAVGARAWISSVQPRAPPPPSL